MLLLVLKMMCGVVLAEQGCDEVRSRLFLLRTGEEEVLKRVGVFDVVVISQVDALIRGTILQRRKHGYVLVHAQRILKTEGKGLLRAYAFANLRGRGRQTQGH